MTFWFRLRYALGEIRTDANWRTIRALGVGYAIYAVYLSLSFPFGYRVGCFGQCGRRTGWDPIIGAWCDDCQRDKLYASARRLDVIR